jgi:hypothetical protein
MIRLKQADQGLSRAEFAFFSQIGLSVHLNMSQSSNGQLRSQRDYPNQDELDYRQRKEDAKFEEAFAEAGIA